MGSGTWVLRRPHPGMQTLIKPDPEDANGTPYADEDTSDRKACRRRASSVIKWDTSQYYPTTLPFRREVQDDTRDEEDGAGPATLGPGSQEVKPLAPWMFSPRKHLALFDLVYVGHTLRV